MALHRRTAGVTAITALVVLAGWSFSRPPAGRTPQAQAADEEPKARDYLLVPGRRAGVLALVGREVTQSDKDPEERVVSVLVDGAPVRIVRLRAGDGVKKGQLLGRIDNLLARKEVQIKEAKVQAAEAELRAAAKTKDEAKIRWDRSQRLPPGLGGREERDPFRVTWERHVEEEASKAATLKVARSELELARALLDLHEIRSPVSGIIQAVLKREGEAVREHEPVFRILPDSK
jgi:multidrug efflux pump subunit AcrA (membrane-fusion protein)